MDDESEIMFKVGLAMAGFVLLLTASLQVCYRTQNRARARVHKEIVKTQQNIAVADASFSAYVGNDILRTMVVSVYPKAEVITFNKTISVSELSDED